MDSCPQDFSSPVTHLLLWDPESSCQAPSSHFLEGPCEPTVSPPGHHTVSWPPPPGCLPVPREPVLLPRSVPPVSWAQSRPPLDEAGTFLSPAGPPATHRPGPLLDDTPHTQENSEVKGRKAGCNQPTGGGRRVHIWALQPQVEVAQGWTLRWRRS